MRQFDGFTCGGYRGILSVRVPVRDRFDLCMEGAGMSIHIEAKPGEIAPDILLPGDPLRARFIAESILEGAVQFNRVRNMLGYTGLWKGRRVSVMGTGMGLPSLSIYVNELLREYGVRRLIRVGTCGGLRRETAVRDLVLAISASTDSAVNRIRFRGMDYAPAASFPLLLAAYQAAVSRGCPVHVGPVISSDSFYTEDPEQWRLWARFGVLAVEMETAELYTLAAKVGAQALSVLTVSDNLVTGDDTSSADRETSFRAMAELALDTVSGP
ncbi:MAG TPA: purine-nucleoside phosphorylase [Magnetospirillaceae bacterium]|nr:purine-nucleoside phosphorylase [Magnetospirillaceae bacterium]